MYSEQNLLYAGNQACECSNITLQVTLLADSNSNENVSKFVFNFDNIKSNYFGWVNIKQNYIIYDGTQRLLITYNIHTYEAIEQLAKPCNY